MVIGSDHRIVSAKKQNKTKQNKNKQTNKQTKQQKQTTTTTSKTKQNKTKQTQKQNKTKTTTTATWPTKITTSMKRRAGSKSYGLERKDKNSNWKQTTALNVSKSKKHGYIDDQYQLISDTLVEVAAEIAPQSKRKKQITEEGTIETLDRKRNELRETQEKKLHKRLHNYTVHVNTVRKKQRQRTRKMGGADKIYSYKWKEF